jgi:hypothetical protein
VPASFVRRPRFALAVALFALVGLTAAVLPAAPTASAQPVSGPWIETDNNGFDPDTVTVLGWPDGTSVTVEVDHENDGTFDQQATLVVSEAGTTFTFQRQPGAEESEEEGSLPPGALVRATGSDLVVRELVVPDFRVEYVDPAGDVVAGYAPEGTLVRVSPVGEAPQPSLDATADADGLWSVDFSGTYDVAADEWIRAEVSDADADVAVSEAQAVAPTITAPYGSPQSFVGPVGWPYGTPLTVTVDTDADGTPEATTVKPVWPIYDRIGTEPVSTYPGGTVITATGRSGGTKVLVVEPLTVDATDIVTDTVRGTASPGATVVVTVAEGVELTAVADGDGDWETASFNPPFDLVNPPPYQWAEARVVDGDGDSTFNGRSISTPAVLACVGGSPSSGCAGGSITAMFWDEGTMVSAELDTDSDGTVDHTFGPEAATPGGPTWNLDPSWMVDGSTVRISDDGTVKELTVRALTVEGVDADLDLVHGTGPASTTVMVVLMTSGQPFTSLSDVPVDAEGNWEASFSGSYDIVAGTSAQVVLAEPDGDASIAYGQTPIVAGWLAPYPSTGLVDGQEIDVAGGGWPSGYDLGVVQCRLDVPLSPDACDGTTSLSYPIAPDGTMASTFTVHRTLALSGDVTYDCLSGQCGLLGIVTTPEGGLVALDMPSNNRLSFGLGTVSAVTPGTDAPATDLVADVSGTAPVTVHGSGLAPEVEVTILRCQANGDPVVDTSINPYLCTNVDGSPAFDEHLDPIPAPAGYRTTTDTGGEFTLSVDVPEGTGGDPNCGTAQLCRLVVTASSGPTAVADADGNEARLQFRLPFVPDDPGISWSAVPFSGDNVWLASFTEDTSIFDVRPWNHAAPDPAAPSGIEFPVGTVELGVHVDDPGDSAVLVLQSSAEFNGYYALVGGAWQAFPTFGEPGSPSEGAPVAVQFEVQDGGPGDLDGVADGVIRHRGAAAVTPSSPTIHPGNAAVTEGDAGSVVVQVPVSLSNPSAEPVTVDWETLDTGAAGIATAGVDYEAASGTVTFAPGETAKTVAVTVYGDTVDEPPLYLGEWVLVRFFDPSPNATLDLSFFGLGLGIVVDDDPPPTVHPGNAGVTEGDAGSVVVQVPVSLSNPSAEPVTVDWSTLDTGGSGVATAGVDYEAASGTVTFAPGETSKVVSITVYGDTADELPLYLGEWILVAFSNPSANATLDTSFFGLGIGIILDDDPAA